MSNMVEVELLTDSELDSVLKLIKCIEAVLNDVDLYEHCRNLGVVTLERVFCDELYDVNDRGYFYHKYASEVCDYINVSDRVLSICLHLRVQLGALCEQTLYLNKLKEKQYDISSLVSAKKNRTIFVN